MKKFLTLFSALLLTAQLFAQIDPTPKIEIIASCAIDDNTAVFDLINRNSYPVTISFTSGESFKGPRYLEPNVDNQIMIYTYSLISFTYNSVLFKTMATNNNICGTPQTPYSNVFAYGIGRMGGINVVLVENKNNFPVTLQADSGFGSKLFEIPANGQVYVIGENEDFIFYYAGIPFVFIKPLNVAIKEASFISATPVCMDATTATFEIKNNDGNPHDAILRNASGTEHRYTLAASGSQTVTVENCNWDIYLAVPGWVDICNQLVGDHIKVGSVAPANAQLTISDKTVEIDANPNTQNMMVSSDRAWTASSDQPWLTLNKTSGTGNEEFILSASANTSGITRTATITITAGCQVETVSVTQWIDPHNSLNFDGINDYVAIADNDAILSTAFTIAGWVLWQPNSTTDVQFICGKELTQMEIQTGGAAGANGLRFIPTTGVYLDAANVLPVGKWTHVACVYDAAESIAKMYINGNEVTLVNHGSNPVGTALQSTATSFYLGSRSNGSYFFKGNLDEFSLWNRTLSQSEIQQNRLTSFYPALQTGLVSYYKFNTGVAGSGNADLTSLFDYAGNFNGTLYNFTLTGATSNWVESFAMVAPTTTAATNVTLTGFTTNWTVPPTGSFDNYLLEVATNAAFTSLVSGYNPKTIAAGTNTETISGLTPGTTYYYRVRADKTSVTGQGAYSNSTTAQTLPKAPTVTTQAVSSIGINNAIGNGNITDLGGPNPTAYGICWGASVNPTTSNNKADKGAASATGAFTAQITGLATGTTYHVRAFATNTAGTSYGDDVTFTTTELGNALNFDGTDDNVVTTDNDATISTAFTIAGWVLWQPNSTTDIQFICGKGYEQMEIHTGAGANGLRFIPTTGVYLDAANVLPVGKWTHVACVYDAGNSIAKMYINGNEVALVNHGSNPVGTALQSTATSFYLGSRSTATYFLKGNLDEFSLWNRALTQSEIQQNRLTPFDPALQTGLISYYKFDTGVTGGTNTGLTSLTDHTGNFNGTLNNFALTGATSNWVESYAMVVPTATAATNITTTGFTANWTAPAIGAVDNYLLDVATDAAFTGLVSGYNPKTITAGTLSETITGLTPGTTYYYRVRANKTSVTGQGAYSNTITIQTSTPFTWSGTGTWNETAKWTPASLPTTNAGVTISNGTLTIDQDVSVSSVAINAGAAVTVATGKTLTINGNLSLKSNAAGTASLINNGMLTVGGITSAERYLTGNGWHMISSPVSGQSIASFLGANSLVDAKPSSDIHAMKNYLEATDVWSELFTNTTPGNLSDGNGFAVWPTVDGTVNFSGTLQTGTTNVTVTRTPTTGYGWNLVGNPYSSAIAINANTGADNFITLNSSNLTPSYAAIYLWEQGSSAYTIINQSDAAFYAQSGQGFFVKAAIGATQVSFTPALQSHQTGATFKNGTIPWPEIKLTASLGNMSNNTVIRFNDAMNHGLDVGYDAGILKSGFDLYTKLVDDNGVDFGIQCLPLEANKEMMIPIGLESNTKGTVVLSVDINNLPSDCQLALEDRETGMVTPINKSGQVANIQVAAKSKLAGRFFLHTSYLKNTTGTPNLADDWHIWIVKGQICISGAVTDHSTATIYDLLGRKVGDYPLQHGTLNYIPCSDFRNGVYLMNIRQQGKSSTRKISVINE